MADLTRTCTKCLTEKPASEFYIRPKRPSGYDPQCKTCILANNARWAAQNKDAVRAMQRRSYKKNQEERLVRSAEWKQANPLFGRANWIQRKYGISLARFDEILESQGGLCAVCGGEMVPPHIDHDHVTGVVRGILCRGCNMGLGHFYDKPENLRRAASYLDGTAPN